MLMAGADFLSGSIAIERGEKRDYRGLAHLHYVPGDPATMAGVWRAVWRDFGLEILDFGLDSNSNALATEVASPRGGVLDFDSESAIQNPKSSRVIAVAVLSYPTPSSRAREAALGLGRARDRERILWLNANVRTISRVIVHPQFRSLGIASALVRRVLDDCPVRYVEAFAAMGRVVPFFQKAGMKEVCEGYFLFDREELNRGGRATSRWRGNPERRRSRR